MISTPRGWFDEAELLELTLDLGAQVVRDPGSGGKAPRSVEMPALAPTPTRGRSPLCGAFGSASPPRSSSSQGLYIL